MPIKYFTLSLLCLFALASLAQAQAQFNPLQVAADSLLTVLKTAKHDTDKLNTYIKIAEVTFVKENKEKYTDTCLFLIDKYSRSSDKKQKEYVLRKKVELCDNVIYGYGFFKILDTVLDKKYENICASTYAELKDTSKLVDYFLWRFGIHYWHRDETTHTIEMYQKALTLAKQSKNKKLLGYCYHKIATAVADYNTSIKYGTMALPLLKEVNDTDRVMYCLMSIGRAFSQQKNIDSALYYYNQIFLYAENHTEEDRYRNKANYGIAELYKHNADYEKALEYLKKLISGEYGHSIDGNSNTINGRIAKLFCDMGKPDSALAYLQKEKHRAFSFYKSFNNKMAKEIAEKSFLSMDGDVAMEVYYKNKNYKQAKEYLDKTRKSAYSLEDTAYWHLAYQIDTTLGNYKTALSDYIRYAQAKNELSKEDLSKQLLSNEFNDVMEKKQMEQEQQNAIAAAEMRRQRIILIFVSCFLVLVALLAVVIFRSLRVNQQKNKIITAQKHLVEEKQKEVLESITYAKRLQQAILPPQEYINKFAPKHFILYKPKDIVAGDFYWSENVGDLFFIAAADSTGHGVPGAMVSVVCSNALNRTVLEFGVTETGKILDKTRELVIETFVKSSSEVKDGMDISLLCIDLKNKNIFWSGANNPLWYVQDNELKEIKADKQPIGKTENPKPFTTHQIDYKENTMFYLFTDGLADQFGGEKGKKFKYKPFADMLLNNSHLQQEQQAEIIDKVFSDWKGALEQVDDVCVIGVRV